MNDVYKKYQQNGTELLFKMLKIMDSMHSAKFFTCLFTARKRNLGQGNVLLAPVILSTVEGGHCRGVSLTKTSWTETPRDRDPQIDTTPGQRPPMDRDPLWTETLLDRDPLGRDIPLDRDTPGQRPPVR